MRLIKPSVLAIIPARGGSKGIPRKNLISLNGKPLLAYTIEAAIKSKMINQIRLSSEDKEIIKFGESMGLCSNYIRPSELATDESETIESVIHILNWLELHENYIPEIIVLLQPTSPLRTADDIDQAINFYLSNSLESLTTVHKMKEHPYDCIRRLEEEWVYLAEKTKQSNRRQDYEPSFFYINGAIYIASLDFIINNKRFINKSTFMYEIEPEKGIEIDEITDLYWAEFLINNKKRNGDKKP